MKQNHAQELVPSMIAAEKAEGRCLSGACDFSASFLRRYSFLLSDKALDLFFANSSQEELILQAM